MSIGRIDSPEWYTETDPETGRTLRRLTSGRHNNYPLYYFIPSIPPEDDCLIFHSERTGWVQLHKLDLRTGEICQLSNGQTRDYESNVHNAETRDVWYGRYDLESDTWSEVQLPGLGYVHTGNDPTGRFLFVENQDGSKGHQLLSIHHPHDLEKYQLNLLHTLTPIIRGQRFPAHPFLGPDRRWLYFTEVIDGFSQVSALDVRDLVDLDEYWA